MVPKIEVLAEVGLDREPLHLADWHLDGDGISSETSWYADQKTGLARTWYPDGQMKSRGRYERGQGIGLWEFWRPDGTVDEERTGVREAVETKKKK